MKNITLLFFLTILPLLGFSQDVVYTFDTDTEGWGQSGCTVTNDGLGHLQLAAKADNTWGNFSGAKGPVQSPTLDANNYLYVKIVFENTTDFTTWQIVNHLLGDATFNGASNKTDFNAPTASGFTTAYVAIPSNGTSTIERISVRAKGQPTSGTFKIDEFRILYTPPTFSEFVKNPDFEDNKAFLSDWSLSNSTDVSANISMDANHGSQSARLDIITKPTSNVLFQNTYTKTFAAPVTTIDGDKVSLTWDMKSNSTTLAVAARFALDLNGGGTQNEYTGDKSVSVSDTWESISLNKPLTLGNDCVNIRDLAFIIKSATVNNGDYVLIDNITATITIGGVTLSVSDKDLKNNNIVLYPNPVQNILNVKSTRDIASVSVYDITGKQVLASNKITNKQLNVSSLKNGIYVVKLQDVNHNFEVKKLVISK